MGKLGKFITLLSLILGIAFFALGIKVAGDNGMSVTDIGIRLINNLKTYQTGSEGASFEKINKEEEHVLDPAVNEIHLRAKFADLIVQHDDTDTVRVTLSGDINTDLSKEILSTSTTDNAFYLNVAENTNFKPTSGGLKATITIPKSFNGKLYVKNESGDINVTYHGKYLEVYSISGNINASSDSEEDVTADIESTSGDINLKGTDIRYILKTHSGNIGVTGTNVSGDIASTSGSALIKADYLKEDSTVKTVSGDIDVSFTEGFDFSAGSTSGEIMAEGGKFTGSKKLPVNGGGNLIDISSISGDILINEGQ